jgi:hypothetical protein
MFRDATTTFWFGGFKIFKIFSFLNCHTVELCRLAHQFSLCFPTVCKPNTCYVLLLGLHEVHFMIVFHSVDCVSMSWDGVFFWLFVFIGTSTEFPRTRVPSVFYYVKL